MTEPTTDWRRLIIEQEQVVLEAQRKLSELRRRAPLEPFEDHVLKTWDGEEVRISALFDGRQDLILVHNMGQSCAYCTLWADGFNGVVEHLEDRAAFVVVSPDSPEVQRRFATGRGWRFRMASAEGSRLYRDAGFEDAAGEPMPGVSTFRKDEEGRLFRVASAEFGPGDDFCGVWHLLDLLAGGAGGWEPRFHYR